MWYRTMKNRIFISTVLTLSFAFALLCFTGCSRHEDPIADDGSAVPETTPIPVISVKDIIPEKPADTSVQALEETATEENTEPDPGDYFRQEEISDEVFSEMQGKSWPEGCTIAREDLRYLSLLYKDVEGNVHEGEMICNKKIADTLIDIFRQLYEADYPIEKMVLIDEYAGDDDASMSDNNTSCFNYRVVSGTNNLSKHAMGLAVDLNPRYNPYIRKVNGAESIEPENGKEYADRSQDFQYKIDKEDLAYKLFTQAGFTWGGSWKSVKDYQHFQYD